MRPRSPLYFSGQPDRLDLLRLAMGEIGQRPMLDLAVVAIRLAQQMAEYLLPLTRVTELSMNIMAIDVSRTALRRKKTYAKFSGYISNGQMPSTH